VDQQQDQSAPLDDDLGVELDADDKQPVGGLIGVDQLLTPTASATLMFVVVATLLGTTHLRTAVLCVT